MAFTEERRLCDYCSSMPTRKIVAFTACKALKEQNNEHNALVNALKAKIGRLNQKDCIQQCMNIRWRNKWISWQHTSATYLADDVGREACRNHLWKICRQKPLDEVGSHTFVWLLLIQCDVYLRLFLCVWMHCFFSKIVVSLKISIMQKNGIQQRMSKVEKLLNLDHGKMYSSADHNIAQFCLIFVRWWLPR